LILAGLTLADGLMRWLANRPIEGVRDVGALAIAVAVACCLPIGLAEKSNITIRLAETAIGPRFG
jgi:TRAP-type transport system small permease protein